MAATLRRITRRGEADLSPAARFDLFNEQLRQRARLGGNIGQGDAFERRKPCVERGESEDRRRAGQELQDPLGRPVIVNKGERVGMAHPALQWV